MCCSGHVLRSGCKLDKTWNIDLFNKILQSHPRITYRIFPPLYLELGQNVSAFNYESASLSQFRNNLTDHLHKTCMRNVWANFKTILLSLHEIAPRIIRWEIKQLIDSPLISLISAIRQTFCHVLMENFNWIFNFFANWGKSDRNWSSRYSMLKNGT